MGGLYNMLAGWNPACVWLAPMLTDENPQYFFPRFRDCWLSDEGDTIIIFTRVGGGNRSDGPDDEYGDKTTLEEVLSHDQYMVDGELWNTRVSLDDYYDREGYPWSRREFS